MKLSIDDINNGVLLHHGKILEAFNFEHQTIYKLGANNFFLRLDSHSLPSTGFFSEIKLYDIKGRMALIYLANSCFTWVEPISVIESKTTLPFDGFSHGKVFELTNKQIWQQISPINSPCSSSGNVKIINNRKLIVDGWGFYPVVELIKENSGR